MRIKDKPFKDLVEESCKAIVRIGEEELEHYGLLKTDSTGSTGFREISKSALDQKPSWEFRVIILKWGQSFYVISYVIRKYTKEAEKLIE